MAYRVEETTKAIAGAYPEKLGPVRKLNQENCKRFLSMVEDRDMAMGGSGEYAVAGWEVAEWLCRTPRFVSQEEMDEDIDKGWNKEVWDPIDDTGIETVTRWKLKMFTLYEYAYAYLAQDPLVILVRENEDASS